MAKVFVSSGHSASDPGAVKYVVERDEVWEIANYVAEELKKLGVTAYRDAWDDSMRDTVAKANNLGVDLFIDIHENAGGGDGAEVLIHNSSRQHLADCMREAFAAVGQNWRRTIINPNFYVLNSTNAPSCIIEVAFVDNAEDIAAFDSPEEKRALAVQLAKACVKFLGLTTPELGWIKDNTGWWYKNTDGSYPKATWSQIGGEWYYFNGEGYAVVGWYFINGKWYLFNEDCKMQTGWQRYQDKWYYLKPSDGDMVSDEFRLVGDTWYMFTPSGEMVQNKVLNISDDGSITVVENKDTVH